MLRPNSNTIVSVKIWRNSMNYLNRNSNNLKMFWNILKSSILCNPNLIKSKIPSFKYHYVFSLQLSPQKMQISRKMAIQNTFFNKEEILVLSSSQDKITYTNIHKISLKECVFCFLSFWTFSVFFSFVVICNILLKS